MATGYEDVEATLTQPKTGYEDVEATLAPPKDTGEPAVVTAEKNAANDAYWQREGKRPLVGLRQALREGPAAEMTYQADPSGMRRAAAETGPVMGGLAQAGLGLASAATRPFSDEIANRFQDQSTALSREGSQGVVGRNVRGLVSGLTMGAAAGPFTIPAFVADTMNQQYQQNIDSGMDKQKALALASAHGLFAGVVGHFMGKTGREILTPESYLAKLKTLPSEVAKLWTLVAGANAESQLADYAAGVRKDIDVTSMATDSAIQAVALKALPIMSSLAQREKPAQFYPSQVPMRGLGGELQGVSRLSYGETARPEGATAVPLDDYVTMDSPESLVPPSPEPTMKGQLGLRRMNRADRRATIEVPNAAPSTSPIPLESLQPQAPEFTRSPTGPFEARLQSATMDFTEAARRGADRGTLDALQEKVLQAADALQNERVGRRPAQSQFEVNVAGVRDFAGKQGRIVQHLTVNEVARAIKESTGAVSVSREEARAVKQAAMEAEATAPESQPQAPETTPEPQISAKGPEVPVEAQKPVAAQETPILGKAAEQAEIPQGAETQRAAPTPATTQVPTSEAKETTVPSPVETPEAQPAAKPIGAFTTYRVASLNAGETPHDVITSVLSVDIPRNVRGKVSGSNWSVDYEVPSKLGVTGSKTQTAYFPKKTDALAWIEKVKATPLPESAIEAQPAAKPLGQGDVLAKARDALTRPPGIVAPGTEAAGKVVEMGKNLLVDTAKRIGDFGTRTYEKGAKAVKDTHDYWKGYDAPETLRTDPEAAQKLVRYASWPIEQQQAREYMGPYVWGKHASPELKQKAYAVQVESQLRGTFDKFTKVGDERANDVRTLVGPDNFFKTEAEYKAAFNDPKVKGIIQRWNKVVNPMADRNYAITKGLGEETPVPSQGAETGSIVNLIPLSEEEFKGLKSEQQTAFGSRVGNLTTPRRTFNPNIKERTGAAPFGYSLDPDRGLNYMIGHGEKAARVEATNALLKSGIATDHFVSGENRRALDVTLPQAGKDPKAGELPKTTQTNKTLWIDAKHYDEVRRAYGLDEPVKTSVLVDIPNTLQLLSPYDAYTHIKNGIMSVATAEGGKTHAELWVRGAASWNLSVLDAVRRIATYMTRYSMGDISVRERAYELTKLGVGKRIGSGTGEGALGKLINRVYIGSELALQDLFKDNVAAGRYADTPAEANRFINTGIGQYNELLHSREFAMVKAKLNQFLTANLNYNRLSVKNVLGSPRAQPTSFAVSAEIRASKLAGFVMLPIVAAAASNYLTYGQCLPPGVKMGQFKYGEDEHGNPKTFDALTFNLVRRGLTKTGIGAILEGKRLGMTAKQTADMALQDVAAGGQQLLTGPGTQFQITATTGLIPSAGGHGMPKLGPAAPEGESQVAENVKTAFRNVNPSGQQYFKGGVNEIGAGFLKNIGLSTYTGPKTASERLINDAYIKHAGSNRMTEEEKATVQARGQMRDALRAAKTTAERNQIAEQAVKDGHITDKQAWLDAKRATKDETAFRLSMIPLPVAKQAMDAATPEEKQAWQSVYDHKIAIQAAHLAVELDWDDRKKLNTQLANAAEARQKLKDVGATHPQILNAAEKDYPSTHGGKSIPDEVYNRLAAALRKK